jgi:hypothetical protein
MTTTAPAANPNKETKTLMTPTPKTRTCPTCRQQHTGPIARCSACIEQKKTCSPALYPMPAPNMTWHAQPERPADHHVRHDDCGIDDFDAYYFPIK